jgi:drug/metabolite transporter (DMT)-like permease
MACDFQAIAELGASVSRVILFGFPAVVMLLSAAETRTLPSLKKLAGFSVAWLGLLCVASPGFARAGDAPFGPSGLAWGFASLAFYAVYVWLSGKVSQRLGSVRLTSVSNLSTAAVVVLVVLIARDGEPPTVSAPALGWVAIMVLVSTVFPYFLLMEGIVRLGSSDASLISMCGPLVTVLAGVWFLDESLSTVQMIGTVLTI